MAISRDNDIGASSKALQQAVLNLKTMELLSTACLALLVVVESSAACDDEIVITADGSLVVKEA